MLGGHLPFRFDAGTPALRIPDDDLLFLCRELAGLLVFALPGADRIDAIVAERPAASELDLLDVVLRQLGAQPQSAALCVW
jgi:hypothetical protein